MSVIMTCTCNRNTCNVCRVLHTIMYKVRERRERERERGEEEGDRERERQTDKQRHYTCWWSP